MKKGLISLAVIAVVACYTAFVVAADGDKTSVDVSVSFLTDTTNLDPTTFTVYTSDKGMTELTGLYLSPGNAVITDPDNDYAYVAGHAYVSIQEHPSDKWYMTMYTNYHDANTGYSFNTSGLVNQADDTIILDIKYMNEISYGEWDLQVGQTMDDLVALILEKDNESTLTAEDVWEGDTAFFRFLNNLQQQPPIDTLTASFQFLFEPLISGDGSNKDDVIRAFLDQYDLENNFAIATYKLNFPYDENRIQLIFAIDLGSVFPVQRGDAAGYYRNEINFEMVILP